MKLTSFILVSTVLFSQNPEKVMDEFVYRYLLITKSKMQSSPLVWQDLKEGYLRNYTIRYADILLDSLDKRELSSFYAGVRHFQKIEDLRIEIKEGGEFKYVNKFALKPKYNINYFSSSIE